MLAFGAPEVLGRMLHLTHHAEAVLFFTFLLAFTCFSVGGCILRAAILRRSIVAPVAEVVRGGARFLLVLALVFGPLAVGGRIWNHHRQVKEAEHEARTTADSAEFSELISTALDYKSSVQGFGGYPPHSLIVYVNFGERVNWKDAAHNEYHYACPEFWLARTRDDARIVALVSWNHDAKPIGVYSTSHKVAYQSTWTVRIVDLELKGIIARATITMSDPSSISALPMDWFQPDHMSPPSTRDVEQAILSTGVLPEE